MTTASIILMEKVFSSFFLFSERRSNYYYAFVSLHGRYRFLHTTEIKRIRNLPYKQTRIEIDSERERETAFERGTDAHTFI